MVGSGVELMDAKLLTDVSHGMPKNGMTSSVSSLTNQIAFDQGQQ